MQIYRILINLYCNTATSCRRKRRMQQNAALYSCLFVGGGLYFYSMICRPNAKRRVARLFGFVWPGQQVAYIDGFRKRSESLQKAVE
jgi:hypothetical protein